MAEKRRAPESKSLKAENDEEFLGQAGVSVLLGGALLKLLEVRPEDPIAFLSEHFSNEAMESESGGGGGGGEGEQQDGTEEQQQLTRALWHLKLAHHSHRSAFSNNIRTAYELLSQRGAGRREPGGVQGHLYNQILQCVCSSGGLSGVAAAPLLQRLRCREYEAVSFELFRQAVQTCAVFSEYICRARHLYAAVATRPEQPAERALCVAVLDALQEALDTSHGPDATRYLQASAKISPAELARTMAEVRAANRKQEGPSMDVREFEDAAAALFIERVRVLN